MDGLTLHVSSNGKELLAAFGHYARRQLPFGAAKAMTETAKSSRDAVRVRMPTHFDIRRASTKGKTTVRGVTIKTANKTDWPRPTAMIGTLDDFMVDHILGRERDGGDRRRSVPSPSVPPKTRMGKFRKDFKPSSLMEGAKYVRASQLISRAKKGQTLVYKASKKAILIRKRGSPDYLILKKLTAAQRRKSRKSARRKDSGKIRDTGKILFVLKKEQMIERRWPFKVEALRGAQKSFERHFQTEMIAAMLTAKKKGRVDSAYRRIMLRAWRAGL